MISIQGATNSTKFTSEYTATKHLIEHSLGKKYVHVTTYVDNVKVIPKKVELVDVNTLIVSFNDPHNCVMVVS